MSLYLGSSYISDIAVTNPIALKSGVLRPDAELIQSYSYDKYIATDEGLEIPTYTTSSTTLKASANLTPTVAIDYDNYDYCLLERFLAIPEYNVTSKAKGRVEYWLSSTFYELNVIQSNNFIALVDNTTKLTSRSVIFAGMSLSRLFYWSSASAVAIYNSAAYGVAETATAPSVSSGVMTVKSPALIIRGHATYFSSTYFDALTDIRYQYVIDVYRAPKDNLNRNSWNTTQQTEDIITCVNSTTHTLV